MAIRPLHDRVVIRRSEEEKPLAVSLLPGREETREVVAVGTGKVLTTASSPAGRQGR